MLVARLISSIPLQAALLAAGMALAVVKLVVSFQFGFRAAAGRPMARTGWRYAASKVTPALAFALFFAVAMLRASVAGMAIFGLLTLFTAALASFVVWRRRARVLTPGPGGAASVEDTVRRRGRSR